MTDVTTLNPPAPKPSIVETTLADAILLEADPLLRRAIGIAALLEGVIKMGDEIRVAHERKLPVTERGATARLVRSLNKNREAMRATINSFIDLANERRAKELKL